MLTFEQFLEEGINDPGILKCVFTAGGPGSGKSHVAGDLFGIDRRSKASFSMFGLKVVNSDSAFEVLMRKNGVDPAQLHNIERYQPELWQKLTVGSDSLRARAKNLTIKQQELFMQGRLGLLVDGTGASLSKIMSQKEEAEAYGYDTYMVYVSTSLETAMARNRERARRLPDSLVREIWTEVQENRDDFQHLFRKNFIEVVNESHGGLPESFHKAVRSFMRTPIQNPIGQEWVQLMSAQKQTT